MLVALHIHNQTWESHSRMDRAGKVAGEGRMGQEGRQGGREPPPAGRESRQGGRQGKVATPRQAGSPGIQGHPLHPHPKPVPGKSTRICKKKGRRRGRKATGRCENTIACRQARQACKMQRDPNSPQPAKHQQGTTQGRRMWQEGYTGKA